AAPLLTDAALKAERNVVAEENAERHMGVYDGIAEDFLAAAYPQGPYNWATIGDMAQLRDATTGELRAFHDAYYSPSNAVLVIAGDIETSDAAKRVERYF